MSWIELFEILVNDLSILDYYRRELRPRGWKGPESGSEINVETVYLFKLIFKFIYESYLLLNLPQIIYEFCLKYFESYFVTILTNLPGSV